MLGLSRQTTTAAAAATEKWGQSGQASGDDGGARLDLAPDDRFDGHGREIVRAAPVGTNQEDEVA